ADVSGVDITRAHAGGELAGDLAYMQVARTHDALQLLHATRIGVAGTHVHVHRHAGRQLHGDFEIGVGVAEQAERKMAVVADVEPQLVTLAMLGHLQLLQRRLLRGAGPPGEAEPLVAVAADEVQVLAVHVDLHRLHAGQVELQVAWRLELAGRGENSGRGEQQRGESETTHGRTPGVGIPVGMQPAGKRLQARSRGRSGARGQPGGSCALASCHSASCSARSRPANVPPSAAASSSILRKRRSNFALAWRNAREKSTPAWRARFTATNSTSPISSSSRAGSAPPANSARTSSTSSTSLSSTGCGPGQVNPAVAARCCSFSARLHSGSPLETPASTLESAASPLPARSAVLMASHARVCSATSAWRTSPNTCGCRRRILLLIACTTSANPNRPASSAMRAWNTTCSSRSPSSSRKSSKSPRSIASATSYASSIV